MVEPQFPAGESDTSRPGDFRDKLAEPLAQVH